MLQQLHGVTKTRDFSFCLTATVLQLFTLLAVHKDETKLRQYPFCFKKTVFPKACLHT